MRIESANQAALGVSPPPGFNPLNCSLLHGSTDSQAGNHCGLSSGLQCLHEHHRHRHHHLSVSLISVLPVGANLRNNLKNVLIILQIPTQSCFGCHVTLMTALRRKSQETTPYTRHPSNSPSMHLTSHHLPPPCWPFFPVQANYFLSLPCLSRELQTQPFRDGGNEGPAPFSSLKPSATITLEEDGFFFLFWDDGIEKGAVQVPPDHCEAQAKTQGGTKAADSHGLMHASQSREGNEGE